MTNKGIIIIFLIMVIFMFVSYERGIEDGMAKAVEGKYVIEPKDNATLSAYWVPRNKYNFSMQFNTDTKVDKTKDVWVVSLLDNNTIGGIIKVFPESHIALYYDDSLYLPEEINHNKLAKNFKYKDYRFQLD